MLQTLKKLYNLRILSTRGARLLFRSVFNDAPRLICLLRIAAGLNGKKVAIKCGSKAVSYGDLYQRALDLSARLTSHYLVNNTSKVAIIAPNSIDFVTILFGAADTGADVYLLNREISAGQFETLAESHQFDLVICDPSLQKMIIAAGFKGTIESIHQFEGEINGGRGATAKLAKGMKAGRIIILTSGTTGNFKIAPRKPSFSQYLSPFLSIVDQCDVDRFQSIAIPIPLFHGFGLASLFMSIAFGYTIYIEEVSGADGLSNMIVENKIDAVVLVPTLLGRLLKNECPDMGALKCIFTGGAPISNELVCKTMRQFGKILFNLYGTSEAGFCLMADSGDLTRFPGTVGKEIPGVRLRIMDSSIGKSMGSVGMLYVKSKWSAFDRAGEWVATGDTGYRNKEGYYFLTGRADDMIVSGGENVYPSELEQVLRGYAGVIDAAVIGVPDDEFGQRLRAFIVTEKTIRTTEIFRWLSEKIPRYQTPKYIDIIAEMPLTAIGKPDKKKLLEISSN